MCRSGEYENNKTLGETFISACDVDQEIVRKQLDTMKERWDSLNNGSFISFSLTIPTLILKFI